MMMMKTIAELSCSVPIEESWKSSDSSMMLMRMKVVMINKILAVQKIIMTDYISGSRSRYNDKDQISGGRDDFDNEEAHGFELVHAA